LISKERVHDLWIELSTRAIPQDRKSTTERHALAIGSTGHQRVMNIRTGKDAPVQTDILSGNSVRIAFAVEPLVVFAYDGQKFLKSGIEFRIRTPRDGNRARDTNSITSTFRFRNDPGPVLLLKKWRDRSCLDSVMRAEVVFSDSPRH
jgi:hypothetical protein